MLGSKKKKKEKKNRKITSDSQLRASDSNDVLTGLTFFHKRPKSRDFEKRNVQS